MIVPHSYVQKMHITKCDNVDQLHTINDALKQIRFVDLGALLRPVLPLFTQEIMVSLFGRQLILNYWYYRHWVFGSWYGQEVVLYDIRYVLSIKTSLLFVGQMDVHGYTTNYENDS